MANHKAYVRCPTAEITLMSPIPLPPPFRPWAPSNEAFVAFSPSWDRAAVPWRGTRYSARLWKDPGTVTSSCGTGSYWAATTSEELPSG
jgi:hypothetical protein